MNLGDLLLVLTVEGEQIDVMCRCNGSSSQAAVFGGLLISELGVLPVPRTAAATVVPTMITTIRGRRHAFPRWSRNA